MPKSLKVRTMAPVHIGDGDVLDNSTLLRIKDDFYSVDFKTIYLALEKSHCQVELFGDWLKKEIDSRPWAKPKIDRFVDTLEYDRQKVFKEQITKLIRNSIKDYHTGAPGSEVYSCLRDMRQRPYIPGSELKGALTTALMFKRVQQDEAFFDDLARLAEKYRSELNTFYDALMNKQRLTEQKKQAGFENFKRMGIKNRQDMRTLRNILGMRGEKPTERIAREIEQRLHLPASQIDTICDLIKEWRQEKKQYQDEIRMAEQTLKSTLIQKIFKELSDLDEKYHKKYFTAETKTDDHKLMRYVWFGDSRPILSSGISPCQIVHKNPNIIMSLYFQTIDSNQDTSLDFQVDEKSMQQAVRLNFSEAQIQQLSVEQLFLAAYEFSKAILLKEKEYFDNLSGGYRFDVSNIKEHIKDLLAANSPETPLLRIGKNQGFMSLTIGLLVEQKHPELLERMIAVVQSNKNNPGNFPITRRVMVDSSGKVKLPGWIQLIKEA